MATRPAYERSTRGRHLVVDEQGIGLRATWHLSRGFVNLSLWRDDRCVETFHLSPLEAGRLVGFLAGGLADAVPTPDRPELAVVADGEKARPGRDRLATGAANVISETRRQLADVLEKAAARLQR